MTHTNDLYPDEPGGDFPPDRPPPQRPPGMQLVDRRRPERITVPFYIIERYGALLGPLCLAVYCGLCYHVAKTRVVWPSYGTLAHELGCSRSTIERSMRTLKEHGLVIVEPYYEGKRQSSNIIYLVDPGTDPRDLRNPSPRPNGGAGPPTAPPRQIDGARAGPPTAPAPANRRTEVDPQEADPEEGAPPSPNASHEERAEVRHLRDLWMSLVCCAAPRLRSEHKAEITAEITELLRRGYPAVHLEREILATDRDRAEWPRLFRQRLSRSRPQKVAYTPSPNNQTAKRLAAERAARNAQPVAGERTPNQPPGAPMVNEFRLSDLLAGIGCPADAREN